MTTVGPQTIQPGKVDLTELPNGLKQLSTISEIRIVRNVNYCEVLFPCNPRHSSFSIQTNSDSGEEILTIRESGICLYRECIGAARDLNLRMNNADDETVASFYRPLMCSRGCCNSVGPCCYTTEHQFITVKSPPDVKLGRVQERETCCNPIFDAFTVDMEEPLLTYTTDRCYLKTCSYFKDVEIDINDSRTGECVAKIIKKSKSDGKELCSFKNDFEVQYTPDLDLTKRLMVIASCLMFNFNNFEYDRRYCT